jgi:excinuclease UvrABC ATPase subunit
VAGMHPADSHDYIRVTGARENNLKDISIEIPKRRLTVFTGVSGSGKSSLVFDTIAAESQRLINETSRDSCPLCLVPTSTCSMA